MHIARLGVSNLRAIESLEIDLCNRIGFQASSTPRKRLILLGANGAGKTSLLHAIAHLFRRYSPNGDAFGDPLLDPSDIYNSKLPSLKNTGASPRILQIEADFVFSDGERSRVRESGQVIRGPHSVQDAIELSPGRSAHRLAQSEINFEEFIKEVGASLSNFTQQPPSPIRAALHPLQAPCVFLPADRGILHYSDDLPLKTISQPPEAYADCLATERKRFVAIAARLGLAYRNQRQDDPDDLSQLMWKVLEKYLPEMPVPLRADGLLLWFRTRGGAEVPLHKLSDGERAVLLIFGDLALRAPEEGVVLIDELEQHLHPRWQLGVLEGLGSMLPNAQLIVTTQSPYLASASPDDILKVGGWDRDGE